jgi:hypothetical protein
MAQPMIVAFLSTGRCGTQWLASGFEANHPELEVEHEPIQALYKPRRYFRRYDDPEAMLTEPEIRDHLARVSATSRPYVETGWPMFAALPLFAKRYPERLRVVHVTRHPVPCAISHLSHQSYAGSWRRSPITRWGTLGPKDRNVFHPEYANRWDELSPYEKCLFFWTELNLYGLEFPKRLPNVPFLRLKSEDLLAGDRESVEQMLRFLDLPWSDGWLEHAGHSVDKWHFHTDEEVDPGRVLRHPATVQVADEFGYDLTQFNEDALQARYSGEPSVTRPGTVQRLVAGARRRIRTIRA